jgi:hypothetical protein
LYIICSLENIEGSELYADFGKAGISFVVFNYSSRRCLFYGTGRFPGGSILGFNNQNLAPSLIVDSCASPGVCCDYLAG